MSNYSNGKIYALKSKQTDEVYIGSTVQTLSIRLSDHKTNYKMWLNGKYHYVSSFEICKYDDCFIELIEEYPCKTKEELFKREGEIQKQIKCINKCIAGRTQKEYNENNKEKIYIQRKEYRTTNKERIKEKKSRIYFCDVCEKELNFDHKARHERTSVHQKKLKLINPHVIFVD